MKRARIVTALAILATGCTALINVPDLELQDASDSGVDGSLNNADGAKPTDGSITPTDSAANDSAACGGANLQTDSNNCGSCGHSCKGLTCTAGACVPVELATGIGTPYMIDQDATYIYFTDFDKNAVERVKKDGSAQKEVLVDTGITYVYGVHITGNTLFFAVEDGVHSCDVSNGAISCASSNVKIAPSTNGAIDVIESDGLIYWGDYDSKIFRAQPDGGARVTLVKQLNDEPDSPFKLAIAGGNIYSTFLDPFEATTLFSAQIDGGAIADAGSLNSSLRETYLVADDAGYAYGYIDYNSSQGIVVTGDHVTKATKGVTPTGAAAGQVDGVALDGQYIYWTDLGSFDGNNDSKGDGNLKRCPRTGCTGDPMIVATGLMGGGPIVVDDTFVYWVENNGGNYNLDYKGRIRKTLKP